MYAIRGKLSSGEGFKATAPDGQLGAALAGVEKAIPEGKTIVSVTLRKMEEKSQLKIIKPREKKEADGATAPAAKTAAKRSR